MNIAVFASGRGSNFQAILNAIQQGVLPANICMAVSNNSSAASLALARSAAIPAFHLSRQQFASEGDFDERLLMLLTRHKAEFIALAGYMKKLSPVLVQQYRHRIANVHPALLPAFGGPGMYGLNVHKAVLDYGAKITGATVHLVDEEYDHGPIVMQKSLAVAPDDTPETLAARVLQLEHEIYPLALKAFAEQRVRIEGRTVWIQPPRQQP